MASLTPLLRGYDQVILDLDGCVWVGEEAVPGSPEAVAALREAGKRVAFATNNSWHAGEDHVARLWGIGVQASLADVVTVGGALQHLLAETRTGRTAVVVGTDALRKHVSDAGLTVLNGTDLASRADIVIVGGGDQLSYPMLREASLAVHRGAELLATGRDPTLPTPEGPWPGTGALLAAVETASGGSAEIVGKPAPRLFETALDRLGEGRTLVVGDRMDSDIAAAHAAGLDSALVLSGGHTGPTGEADGPQPLAVADDLGTLVLGEDR
jgi:glycerol 3-phosphatase-2